MLPTLSAGPRMPALRRLTPNVGASLREARTDPQAIESQLVVAQCAPRPSGRVPRSGARD